MNGEERFYCPKCLIPVEYSPNINRYLCGGTCEQKAYLVRELLNSSQIMDVHNIRGVEDGNKRETD